MYYYTHNLKFGFVKRWESCQEQYKVYTYIYFKCMLLMWFNLDYLNINI